MTDEIDLTAHRARATEARRARADRDEAARLDFGAYLAGLQERVSQMPPPDEREVERERVRSHRQARLERLRGAGVREPCAGTPQRAAWDRVVAAETPEGAAHPDGAESLKACVTLRRWLDRGGHVCTLILSGTPGTGKTVAGWYALAEHGGVCLPAGEIAPRSEWDELRRASLRCGLLVVNDVTERMSAWAWGALSEVVESRHDAGARTLLTCNLSRDALVERMGERMASRLAQGAVLAMHGPDLRGSR